MNTFKTQMREAAYSALLKVNPEVIESVKLELLNGDTAKKIEKRLVKKFGNYNLTANSAILAAYHIEANPELLR